MRKPATPIGSVVPRRAPRPGHLVNRPAFGPPTVGAFESAGLRPPRAAREPGPPKTRSPAAGPRKIVSSVVLCARLPTVERHPSL